MVPAALKEKKSLWKVISVVGYSLYNEEDLKSFQDVLSKCVLFAAMNIIASEKEGRVAFLFIFLLEKLVFDHLIYFVR